MTYALFLGCTVPTRGVNYDVAARSVSKVLGIEFWDSNDFVCCGYPIHSVDHDTFLSLGARNLCVAEEQGLDLVTVCNACTASLTKVNKTLKENESKREKINKIISVTGHEFKGKIIVKHFSRMLREDIGLERIREKVTRPLDGFKIASHYGCHYLKPSEIFEKFDDPIRPNTLDELVSITGAQVLDYENKKQCCGGGILAVTEETSMKMAADKLVHIREAQADAMVLQCPFCSIMYDEYQPTILRLTEGEEPNPTPVLYYPQLLGLAMGLDPKSELGLRKNTVKTKELVKRIVSEE